MTIIQKFYVKFTITELVSVFAIIFMLFGPAGFVTVANATSFIDVYVNNKMLQFPDQPAVVQNDRTMVPLRSVSEALGAEVVWDGKAAIVKRSDKTIIMPVGSKQPTVNGKTVTIDAPATLMRGRTMVPLRFVSEAMGARVEYKSNVVYIFDETKPMEEVQPVQQVQTRDVSGYKVPVDTDIRVGGESPNKQVEISLSLMVTLPLDQQFKDAQSILASKLGEEKASQIVNYSCGKSKRGDYLPTKFFEIGNRQIMVGSTKGMYDIQITVWADKYF